MSVYYHKLWAMLKDKGITQKELASKAGLSTATIFQMKRNEFISLSVLDRIINVLNCDYGEVIINVPKPEEFTSEWLGIINLQHSRELVLETLKEYMQENELTVNEVLEITTLSLNTFKKFMRGKNLSQNSYYKILRLGEDFRDILKQKRGGNCNRHRDFYKH